MIPGIENTHQGRIILFGGGLPLSLDGRVVGALGVSGGTVEQDLAVARPVVQAFGRMEEWSKIIAPLVPARSPVPDRIQALDHILPEILKELQPPLPEREQRILAGAFILSITGQSGPAL